VIKHSILTFSSTIISVILGLVAGIIIARTLGPEGKGLWTILYLIPTMSLLLSSLGLEVAIVYFSGKKEFENETLISNALMLAIILSGICIIFLLALYYTLGRKIFGGTTIQLLHFIGVTVSIPILISRRIFVSLLQGHSKIKEFNIVLVAEKLVFLIVIIFFLIINYITIDTILVSFISSIMLSLIFSLYYTHKLSRIKISFNQQCMRKLLTFGIKGYWGNIFQFLNYRFDMFLVNFFLGPGSVGIYSVAVNLTEMIWYPSSAIATVLLPKASRSKYAESGSLVQKTAKWTFWVTFFLAIVLLISSKFLINILYGKAFLPTVDVVWFLLPGIILFSLTRITATYFIGAGKPIINAAISLLSLIANVILNLIFIPRFGINGAALATTISYTISTILTISIFVKMSGLPFFQMIVVKSKDFSQLKAAFSFSKW